MKRSWQGGEGDAVVMSRRHGRCASRDSFPKDSNISQSLPCFCSSFAPPRLLFLIIFAHRSPRPLPATALCAPIDVPLLTMAGRKRRRASSPDPDPLMSRQWQRKWAGNRSSSELYDSPTPERREAWYERAKEHKARLCELVTDRKVCIPLN